MVIECGHFGAFMRNGELWCNDCHAGPLDKSKYGSASGWFYWKREPFKPSIMSRVDPGDII